MPTVLADEELIAAALSRVPPSNPDHSKLLGLITSYRNLIKNNRRPDVVQKCEMILRQVAGSGEIPQSLI